MGGVVFDKEVSDLLKFYKTNIKNMGSEQEQRELLLNYFEQKDFSPVNAKRFLSLIINELKVPVTKPEMLIYIACIVAVIGPSVAGNGINIDTMFVPGILILAIFYALYRQIIKRNKLRYVIHMKDLIE